MALRRCTPFYQKAADQGGNREVAEQMCHVHISEAEWKVTSSPWGAWEGERAGRSLRTGNQR